jgi:hypothetical protein
VVTPYDYTTILILDRDPRDLENLWLLKCFAALEELEQRLDKVRGQTAPLRRAVIGSPRILILSARGQFFIYSFRNLARLSKYESGNPMSKRVPSMIKP